MEQCPQCKSLVSSTDKYCSQCAFHLPTGKGAMLPMNMELLDKAVQQLEQRLGDDDNKLATLQARSERSFFAVGMVLVCLQSAHFILGLIPYSAYIWWLEMPLLLLEAALPFWLAMQLPSRNYRTVLTVLSIVVFLAAAYRLFGAFL